VPAKVIVKLSQAPVMNGPSICCDMDAIPVGLHQVGFFMWTDSHGGQMGKKTKLVDLR